MTVTRKPKAKRISTTWTLGIRDKESKAKFEESLGLVLTSPIMDRLREVIDQKLLEARKSKTIDYSNPSWAYKQAHDNGVEEGLTSIRELIKL